MLTEEEKVALVDEHIPSRAQFVYEDSLYKLVDAVQEAVLSNGKCVWDSSKAGGYIGAITTCNSRPEVASAEMARLEPFKFCPFCGKKIEVV